MLSIIIPSYNEENYIEDTLVSLRNQDFKGNYEIIVVDCNSEDGTVKIAKKYADKVLTSEKSVAKARNKGASEASGGVLIFVDADTRLLYNALSKIDSVFKEKEVIGATCPVISAPAAKDFIPYWAFSLWVKNSINTNDAKMPGCSLFCRKDVFDRLGGFAEDKPTGEDFDFSSRLSKEDGRLEFIEDTFSITSPRKIRAWGLMNGTKKYIQAYIKNNVLKKNLDWEEYGIIR